MILTTDEKLILQADILSTAISKNPNMIYKSSVLTNTGLNPNYFSENNTKIVNAINLSYSKGLTALNSVSALVDKTNSVIGNVEAEQKALWTQLKTDMNKSNIIEGLVDLYEYKLPKFITKDEIILNIATADELTSFYNSI